MRKFIKKTDSPIFIVMAIIICFVGVVYMSLLASNYNKVKANVDSHVSQWEKDIAGNIYYQKNSDLVKKIFHGLGAYPLSSYEIIVQKNRVDDWSHIPTSDQNCGEKQKIESLFNFEGIRLGVVKACISKQKIAKATLLSPAFILIISITIILLIVSSFMPLFRYKKSLNTIIHTLRNSGGHYLAPPKTNDNIVKEVVDLHCQSISAQRHLEALQTALNAEKEINRIVAQVAHDILRPASDLKEVIKKPDLTKSDVTKSIQLSVKRISQVSQDLLNPNMKNSYRLERARLTDISCITKEAFQNRNLFHANIKFKLDIEKDVKAMCAPIGFQRVLLNLIYNSIDAIDNKVGVIKCSLFYEDFDKKRLCRLTIADNGKGIPTENIDKVFEEHFTSGKKSGNGLGLYYVYKRVKEWGGEIQLHSEVNKGTEITLILKSTKSSFSQIQNQVNYKPKIGVQA